MILFANKEGPDQLTQMRRLTWAFAVHIRPKTRFRMARHKTIVTFAQPWRFSLYLQIRQNYGMAF